MSSEEVCFLFSFEGIITFELILGVLGGSFLLVYSLIYGATFLRHSSFWSKGKSSVFDKFRCPTNRTLIAIAHPDDEVMFFGPTITNLLREGKAVYLVCFSYGDAEGLGLTRKEELWKSCRLLGIPDENVMIVKHDKLKDSQEAKWPVLPIAMHLKSFILAHDIDTLITFDFKGVSGHANHISIYDAAIDLVDRKLTPNCTMYLLTSVSFFRQYFVGIFNIPFAYCSNKYVLVAKGSDYYRIVRAMKAHRSQMLWFRHLHMYFSMYTFLNVLRRKLSVAERDPPTQKIMRKRLHPQLNRQTL